MARVDDTQKVVDIIPAGSHVPFQIGLDTVTAIVIGTVRNGEQYLLMIHYEEANQQTGQYEMVRRLFQRDVKFINSLSKQAGYLNPRGTWSYNLP